MEIINPPSLAAPKGYNHGVLLQGKILFIAGQVGWNQEEELAHGFVGQFECALRNVIEVVTSAGGKITDIGRFTLYVKDKQEYRKQRKEIGRTYRAIMGSHYPAMTLIEVKDLLEEGALIEIEATAVLA